MPKTPQLRSRGIRHLRRYVAENVRDHDMTCDRWMNRVPEEVYSSEALQKIGEDNRGVIADS